MVRRCVHVLNVISAYHQIADRNVCLALNVPMTRHVSINVVRILARALVARMQNAACAITVRCASVATVLPVMLSRVVILYHVSVNALLSIE